MKFKLSEELRNKIQNNKKQNVFECAPLITLEEDEDEDEDENIKHLIVRAKSKSNQEILYYLAMQNHIGEGAYGVVYPAYVINHQNEVEVPDEKDISTIHYVVKVSSINEDQNARENIKEEANMLRRFYITMQPVFNKNKSYIVTQKIRGETFRDQIENLQALCFFRKNYLN